MKFYLSQNALRNLGMKMNKLRKTTTLKYDVISNTHKLRHLPNRKQFCWTSCNNKHMSLILANISNDFVKKTN